MKSTQRTLLIALIFAFIASSLLAVDSTARRTRGGHDAASNPVTAQLATKGRTPKPGSPVELPPPDPCASAETALNGFLPKTVTLKKTSTYWAKLTVSKGFSVLACDPASGKFEVKFNTVKLRQYGKVPYVGGWNSIAPTLSCSLRVSFALNFSPPNTVVLSNLTVLSVNCANSPNWLDNSVVKTGLNKIFPSSIVFHI